MADLADLGQMPAAWRYLTGRQAITTGATDFVMPHCCVELAIVISFAAARREAGVPEGWRRHVDSSSSNALASFKSSVSNPSLNQP
jgi:hypothetical protein